MRTTQGDEYSYAKKCLVATGAAAAVPPPGFVDELCVESVRCLGHGEAADAAAVRDAFSVAKRGGRVCVVGGSWQAVAFRGLRRARRAGGQHRQDESASLVFPEATPIGARLPKDLGKKLRKRLEKRGVTVIALHQIRYVGPNEDNRKASHAVYLARADDAMKTSRCSAPILVVVAASTCSKYKCRQDASPSRLHCSGGRESDATRRRDATTAHLRE